MYFKLSILITCFLREAFRKASFFYRKRTSIGRPSSVHSACASFIMETLVPTETPDQNAPDNETLPQSPAVTSKPEDTTPPPNIKPGLDASDGQAVQEDDSAQPE
jgi:hypothetical protein